MTWSNRNEDWKNANSLFKGLFLCRRRPDLKVPIHCFATGAKMASRFETFSEDKICLINVAVIQTNTKKATNFGLSTFTSC